MTADAPQPRSTPTLRSVRRLSENRWLPAFWLLVIVSLAAAFALRLGPEPHSDWLYYWIAAGNPGRYERGGAVLWLLAIPKALGLSPVVSALLLNAFATAALLWIAYRLDTTPWRVPSLLVAGYLLLASPFMGIVQLDLAAAALVAGGLMAAASGNGRPSAARLVMATLLVCAGVSTKPQYALILWVLCILILPFLLLGMRRPRPPATLALVGCLFTGAVLGFALDSGLRSISGRGEAVRTSSAVTLYAGLLVSGTGEGCGYWSVEAAEAARSDLDRPLPVAVAERLSSQPPSHWAAVVSCKLPQILYPPAYALYWLVESPNIRAALDRHPDRERLEQHYRRALWLERKAYGALTLAMLGLVLAHAMILRRRGMAALYRWLPALWVLSFWGVHAVFEIQGRYFLGLFVLLPILSLATWRVALAASAGPPAGAGTLSRD